MAQAQKQKLSREEEITKIVLRSKRTSYKDLPRISKRMHIIDNRESKHVRVVTNGVAVVPPQIGNPEDDANSEEKKEDENGADDAMKADAQNEAKAKQSEKVQLNWQRVSDILHCLARICAEIDDSEENRVVVEVLSKELNANRNALRSEEFEHELRDLFESNKMEESKVQRVMNGCNQSVIFGPFYQLLKEYFIPNGFNGMKDVRTERGWVIEVHFNPKGVVRILHRRQTQYTQPPDDATKHFKVNWELDMSFTPKMEKCNSVFVRVCGIEFHDDVDSQYKSDVRTKLSGADLIFH